MREKGVEKERERERERKGEGERKKPAANRSVLLPRYNILYYFRSYGGADFRAFLIHVDFLWGSCTQWCLPTSVATCIFRLALGRPGS